MFYLKCPLKLRAKPKGTYRPDTIKNWFTLPKGKFQIINSVLFNQIPTPKR